MPQAPHLLAALVGKLATCLVWCTLAPAVGCLVRQLVGRVQLPFKAAIPLYTAITAKKIYHHTMVVGCLV